MSLIFTDSKIIKIRNPATVLCPGASGRYRLVESFIYYSMGRSEDKVYEMKMLLRSAINIIKSLSHDKLYIKFS